jgi:hypothetical protein
MRLRGGISRREVIDVLSVEYAEIHSLATVPTII